MVIATIPDTGSYRIICHTARGPIRVGNFPTLSGVSMYARDLITDTRLTLSSVSVEHRDGPDWRTVWGWEVAR